MQPLAHQTPEKKLSLLLLNNLQSRSKTDSTQFSGFFSVTQSSIFLLSFFKCVEILHFEMNHSGDGDVFLSYFPSRSDLNFITQQTLRFYFFRLPASLTLALTLSLVGVSSSSDCSHAAHIIIAHIFFRFLINSVHMSVKDHHP